MGRRSRRRCYRGYTGPIPAEVGLLLPLLLVGVAALCYAASVVRLLHVLAVLTPPALVYSYLRIPPAK